jgi:hypothetical protein
MNQRPKMIGDIEIMNREYSLTKRVKWKMGLGSIFFAFGAGILACSLIFQRSFNLWGSFLILLCIVTTIATGIARLYDAFFENISVDENGIKYTCVNYKVAAKWVDLKRIGDFRTSRIHSIEGIYLTDHEHIVPAWTDFVDKNFIPVSLFDDNWRTSDLGQQIKQYAPHLFQ